MKWRLIVERQMDRSNGFDRVNKSKRTAFYPTREELQTT